MPKISAPLSDIQIRKAKPADKDYKLSDAGGLYLLVTPTGGKLWRLAYRYTGKQKTLYFGAYPALSLADARQRREDAKKLLANGVDPGEVKKAQKTAVAAVTENAFEVVAREWHGKFKTTWSEVHANTLLERLERDIFPYIGTKVIAEIKPPALLAVLRRVESRGALDTAHRERFMCGQIFRYAIATGRAERDPSTDLRGALPPVKFGHRAAPTDPKDVAPLLRAIDDFKCTFPVKCALQLLPLVFCRPGELRAAEWAEFDFENEQWNIPAIRMKMKEPHIVPLSRQAIAILKELQPLTGSGRYLFPSLRSAQRCMSDNTLNASFRRMGFEKHEISAHGFRAMARTILDEVLQVRPDFIEHQLAHAVRDANGRAYNRTSHLAERRKMMQTWSDYLDGLKQGAKVIPFKRAEGER
jgi:integrase